MSIIRALAPWRILVLGAGLASGCATSTDPFTSGPGNASVQGQVTDPTGHPMAGTTVRIDCGGSASATVASTDSQGHYLVNLSIPTGRYDRTGGHPACRFTEPASGIAAVQLDTTLGFARGPVLVALQTVNLHEP